MGSGGHGGIQREDDLISVLGSGPGEEVPVLQFFCVRAFQRSAQSIAPVGEQAHLVRRQLLVILLIGLDKAGVVQELFLIQLVQELQIILVGVGGLRQIHVAVLVRLQEIIRGAAVNSKGGPQHPQHPLSAVGVVGEGNLVVGVAVAVGVLLLKGFQHVVEFLHRRRHFLPHVFQPPGVDPGLVVGAGQVRVFKLGQAVDTPVLCGFILGYQELFLQHLGEVGHQVRVLQDVREIPLAPPDVGVRPADTGRDQEVRQSVAGQHQGQLGPPCVAHVVRTFHLDAHFLLNGLDDVLFLPVSGYLGAVHPGHRNGDGLVTDREAGLVVVQRFLRSGGYRRRRGAFRRSRRGRNWGRPGTSRGRKGCQRCQYQTQRFFELCVFHGFLPPKYIFRRRISVSEPYRSGPRRFAPAPIPIIANRTFGAKPSFQISPAK